MGLDLVESELLTEQKAADDWVELSAVCTIREGINSAYLYFETDGNADFYLDDISIVCQDGDSGVTDSGASSEQIQKKINLWEVIKAFFLGGVHYGK